MLQVRVFEEIGIAYSNVLRSRQGNVSQRICEFSPSCFSSTSVNAPVAIDEPLFKHILLT